MLWCACRPSRVPALHSLHRQVYGRPCTSAAASGPLVASPWLWHLTVACSHFGSIALLCPVPSSGPPYPSSEWGSRWWWSIPWGDAPVTHKLSASGPGGSPSGSYVRSLTMHWPSLRSLWCGLSSWGFQRWLFPDNRMRLPCPGWCCSTGRSSWGSWRRVQVSWHYTSSHWNAFPRSRSSSAMRPGLSASVSGLRWFVWHGRPGNHLQTGDILFQSQGQMARRW